MPAREQSDTSKAGQVIETAVVGVTYNGRQGAIAFLLPGDEVWLLREPDNRFDRNAIRVLRRNGRQIGYLNRHLARNWPRASIATACRWRPSSPVLTGTYPQRGVQIRFAVPCDVLQS